MEVFAALAITGECNLSCKMCDLSLPKGKKGSGLSNYYRKQGQLTPRQWGRILDRLGVTEVHIMGVEPLLYREFGPLLRLVRKGGTRRVRLTTNGWLFEEFKREITDWADEVSISVHGMGLLHDRIVGREGSFIRNYRALKHLKEKGKSTRVVFTITPENVHDMIHFYNHFQDFNVIFNHYNYIAEESTLGMCRPVNVFYYQPREMDTRALWRAVEHCRGATFLPGLKTETEMEIYYRKYPTEFVRDGNCRVILDMIAGKRYALACNGDFIPPGRCCFDIELGNALEGELDREKLRQVVFYIQENGFPPACQRLCCYPGSLGV